VKSLIAAGLLLTTVALALGAGADASDKPLIVCSTTQIADFARQVVGDRYRVECIMAPGADPHTYQPTTSDAKLVLAADLCLQNGLHLEGKNWMAVLAKNARKPIVNCTEGIKPLEMNYEGRTVSDPHAWLDPKNAAVYVKNIHRAVCRLDPKGKEQYTARTRLYLAELRLLDGWIKKQFNAIPKDKRILVTSHDAFNYFCRSYGFQNRAPVGWSTGAEVGGGMTPRRRRAVVDSIKSFGVKAVFVETSVNPKQIRQIARDARVAVGGALYSDSMGEAGSGGYDYMGMMRENVMTIVRALK